MPLLDVRGPTRQLPLADADEFAELGPVQQHASEGHKGNVVAFLWQSAGLRAGGDVQATGPLNSQSSQTQNTRSNVSTLQNR